MFAIKRIDGFFSRKGGAAIGGHGAVGTADFIVVSDIIGGRAESDIPFTLLLEGIKMVDANGEPMEYDLATEPAFLHIMNEFSTSTVNQQLEQEWSLSPNPAANEIQLNTIRR